MAVAKIAALATLESGRWDVRDLGGVAPGADLCLGDPVMLVQYEHRGAPCSIDSVEDGAGAATVQYSCRGRGFGHSQVRIETPRLVRIDTQGFSDGRPFSYRLEARRVGSC